MCHWLSAGGHITLVAGVILDHFPGAAGYRLFFVYLFAVTVFGLVLTVIWLRRTKARRAEILEKLKKSGYESLTTEEKKSLFDASKR